LVAASRSLDHQQLDEVTPEEDLRGSHEEPLTRVRPPAAAPFAVARDGEVVERNDRVAIGPVGSTYTG